MASSLSPLPVIPRPAQAEARPGIFELRPDTRLVAAGAAQPAARALATALAPATGFALRVTSQRGAGVPDHAIEFELTAADAALGAEGYVLDVTPARVHIRAPAAAGLFYGVQTLLQLLPPEVFSPYLMTRVPWQFPCVAITDRPRFPWRGLMLDVCRHFASTSFVLRFLDQMALHKLNTFHFHLTEDQGWRIEIKRFPRLTTVGAARASSTRPGDRNAQDGVPYGPYFFTQDDIREIVAYAAARHITVVPEIEMPGHSLAALAGYPELACTGGPFATGTRWGVIPDVYCAGKDGTFAFLQGVLDEVLALFPSEFVHIGGDECPKDRWKVCPDCQARIAAEGLKDEHELQSWFVQRMERYLRSKGRRLIGWDEILEGGLAAGASVMSWRGTQGGIAAAAAGHDVVMTPTDSCYLDYYQSADTAREPEAIGGCLPLQKVYAYDPLPTALPPERQRHILGVQGNIWTEFIPSPRQVEFMTHPRAAALAEVGWTPQAQREIADFAARLPTHLRRLDFLGVHYRPLTADQLP